MVQPKLVAALILTATASAIFALPVPAEPHTHPVSIPWYQRVVNYVTTGKSKPAPGPIPIPSPIPAPPIQAKNHDDMETLRHDMHYSLSHLVEHHLREPVKSDKPMIVTVDPSGNPVDKKNILNVDKSHHGGVHIINNSFADLHVALKDSKEGHYVTVRNAQGLGAKTRVYLPHSGGKGVYIYGDEGTTIHYDHVDPGSYPPQRPH